MFELIINYLSPSYNTSTLRNTKNTQVS